MNTATHDVMVTVRAYYLDAESNPERHHFVFAYRVRIENRGTASVQLKRRRWRITDARGHQDHVEGEGVIGEQPVIPPGESFEYTSGAPLTTPSGIMDGAYSMVLLPDGEGFEVPIPPFSLDSPHAAGRVH
jgi:ApaG protein